LWGSKEFTSLLREITMKGDYVLYRLVFDEELDLWTKRAPVWQAVDREGCEYCLHEISYDYWLLGEDEQPEEIPDIRGKTDAQGTVYAAFIGPDDELAYYAIVSVEMEEEK